MRTESQEGGILALDSKDDGFHIELEGDINIILNNDGMLITTPERSVQLTRQETDRIENLSRVCKMIYKEGYVPELRREPL